MLRNPDLLILDEATANIDTVTEKMLEDILRRLPDTTTRVIIAHRLNTIENADEIFFVNAGEIVRAGSLDQAMDLLLQGKEGELSFRILPERDSTFGDQYFNNMNHRFLFLALTCLAGQLAVAQSSGFHVTKTIKIVSLRRLGLYLGRPRSDGSMFRTAPR